MVKDLYLIRALWSPEDPQMVHTTFSQSPIHNVMVASYYVEATVEVSKDTTTETDRAGIWTRNPQITYVQSMVYSYSPLTEVDGQHKADSMIYLPQMTVK